jgi:phage repressor protein C with HTH and peptisase S24 domain
MKAIGIISTAALTLLLGVAAPSYAQDQQEQKQEQKDKPAEKQAPGKNARQEEKNRQQQDKNNRQEDRSAQQQNKTTQQEEKSAQQQGKNNRQEEKNTQTQRSDGNRGRIPDDRFRANFGREHSFHVSHADYSRDRHFQYGGYSFGFVDAWPDNWLYTQDVYVVEINGVYYLCNPAYPGINITLSIVE